MNQRFVPFYDVGLRALLMCFLSGSLCYIIELAQQCRLRRLAILKINRLNKEPTKIFISVQLGVYHRKLWLISTRSLSTSICLLRALLDALSPRYASGPALSSRVAFPCKPAGPVAPRDATPGWRHQRSWGLSRRGRQGEASLYIPCHPLWLGAV